MRVEQIAVGPMANFVYLVTDERSGEALVVDSGWETAPILAAVRRAQGKVKFVVASHGHFDHVSSLRDLAKETGAKVAAHSNSSLDMDLRVEDGDEIRLGSSKVGVIHTPGHTEDSICLYDGRNIFTGDTLFVGTIGRFEKERAPDIYRSLHDKILKLPLSTVMYPGHDYGEVKSRTLGEEKDSNPYLQTRDLRSFLSLFG